MNFGFFTDQDLTRYCYLRLRRLKEALKEPKVLDALIEVLEVPNAAGNKLAAIERRIDELRVTKASVWYGVPAPEVLAASIFGAQKLADGTVQALFSHVGPGADLAAPVVTWLNGSGLTARQALPIGRDRVDIVGYRKAELFSGSRIVGIEVRNDLGQLNRALEQMRTFREYAHAMYLACTPAMAAEVLAEHAAARNVHHWDGGVLQRRLQEAGFGLLLVEGEAVSQALPPREEPPAKAKFDELIATLHAEGG